jgi:glucose-6-phosphate 1-dehydrogenase
MKRTHLEDNLFVILGATGDLTSRFLLPALYGLVRDSEGKTVILGAATTDLDDSEFRARARRALSEAGFDDDAAGAWCDARVHYVDLPKGGDYSSLARRIAEIESLHDLAGNRVFYLALPPSVFPAAIDGLGRAGLADGAGWTRLVVEKPFGRDSRSAAELNEVVHRHFGEEQVYRIDHYLGKETVQNLLAFRFSNPIFEASWNRDRIERVEITVSEAVDVGTRGGYYDQAGAVRDMIQSHLMQVLSLVAMEAPPTLDPDDVRDEKVKVLKSISGIEEDSVVLGQYTEGAGLGAYRSLDGVEPASSTATYAAVRLQIDNWRWIGVPFVLRTGKAMPQRLTEIAVTFRKPPVCFFTSANEDCDVHADVLFLRLQPDEGFDLHIEVKKPMEAMELVTVPLGFRYADEFGEIPAAYETLLRDVIQGDQTRFVRSDWVAESWRLFTPIVEADLPVCDYPAGSWGPGEAERLLEAPRGWASGP